MIFFVISTLELESRNKLEGLKGVLVRIFFPLSSYLEIWNHITLIVIHVFLWRWVDFL